MLRILGTLSLGMFTFVACSGDDPAGRSVEPDGSAGAAGLTGTGGVSGGGQGGNSATAGSGGALLDAGDATAPDSASDAQSDVKTDAESDADSDAGSDASVDAPACVPGEYQCAGDDLQHCNASGSAWDLLQTCKPSHCDSANGQCLDCLAATDCPVVECSVASCQGGSCVGSPLPAGTSCGSSGVCTPAGVCGECVPGAMRCNGDVPQTCSASYSWQSGAQCSSSTPRCDKGVCEPALGPSCSNMTINCGVAQVDSCCDVELAPGGTFKRSYDGVSYTNASWTATVSNVWLDTYEVTVGRFRRFVESGTSTQSNPPAAGSGAHPKIPSSGWISSWNSLLAAGESALRTALICDATYATWTNSPGSNENRPINCVTWFEAFAFCAWDGGRLATEAEWNLAAAAGSEQRVYPWSVPPTSTLLTSAHTSFWVNGTDTCMGDGVPGCTFADILPVGQKPLGRGAFGHDDLSGNVWEWTLDVYINPYAEIPCNDCASLSGSSHRTLRGGSFFANPASILSAKRNFASPELRYFSTGVRCAKGS